VFVDPWLTDSLVFGDNKAFYESTKPALSGKSIADFEPIDLVILTQGLPDHAHPPTLKKLDKRIPVVVSPSAAEVCRKMGFENITVVKPGEKVVILDGEIELEAFSGSLVGPPWSTRENGYIYRLVKSGLTILHEPHCDIPDSVLRSLPVVDVMVSSAIGITMPLLGNFPVVRGVEEGAEIARKIKAKVLFPLTNWRAEGKGMLNGLLKEKGSLEEYQKTLDRSGVKMKVLDPMFNQPVDIMDMISK